MKIIHGDNRDVLRTLADNSIDSVVTDPPYALVSIVKRFGDPNAAPAKGNDAYMRASAGFMGKQWDTGEVAFSEEFWREVLRVLKPGGHIAAFGASRGYHRMACAIEDAGFEIRDSLMWVYGTGFPKSHDVSKGIEKRRIEDIEPVRVVCRFLRAAMNAKGLKSRDMTRHFGDCNARLIDHWAARDTDSQPSLPTNEQWATLKTVLCLGDEKDAEVIRLNARKGEFGSDWHAREITGEVEEWTDRSNYALTSRDGLRRDVAATDAARQWEGWGTALKPAFEPIVLARKPLSEKTVAANVLRWGTGALNIGACRVEAADQDKLAANWNRETVKDMRGGKLIGGTNSGIANTSSAGMGRWPANVVHDGSDEVVGAFPAAGGQQGRAKIGGAKGGSIYGKFAENISSNPEPRGDSGSAARFFYSAKASKADRNGSKHPTVKPIALMQWLARLITPPGGTVLDPFAGSGTTGAAAAKEGFDCILIEREAEYVADIRRRFDVEVVPAIPSLEDMLA